MSPLSTPVARARGRGAVTAHDDETLLDLVAGVARAAAQDPTTAVLVPERVSMRTFNGAKVAFDRARGLVEPTGDPERTPTSNAILMRFNDGATRRISWDEVVAAALSPDRVRWLASVRRAEPTEPVAEHKLVFALRFVAARLGRDTLTRWQYRDKRNELVADDEARYGGDALLGDLLPTLHQLDGQIRWRDALALAGLGEGAAERNAETAARRRDRSGMPHGEAIAYYAAMNGRWPSRVALRAFATDACFGLADMNRADWKGAMEEARDLLRAEGLPVPEGNGPKPLGRGKRLSYEYPVDGIPGAPLPSEARTTARREAGAQRDAAVDELERELCVIGLRVWLAGLGPRDDRTQPAYQRWVVGTGWPGHNRFRHHGGFTTLRKEATAANAAGRRRSGQPVPTEVLQRGEELKRALPERRRGARAAASTSGEPVPFGDAVRVVLAGRRAVGHPPLQPR